MSYATVADLIARTDEALLLRLTDETGMGLIDDAAVTLALADASSEVDGILQHKYAVPLNTIPERLVGLVCDIAFYRLHVAQIPNEDTAARYKAAVSYLRDVAAGRLSLYPVSDPVATAPAWGSIPIGRN